MRSGSLKTKTHLPLRAAELPTTLVFCNTNAEAAHALVETLDRLEAERVLFVFGRASRQLLGASLKIDCPARFVCHDVEAPGADISEVERVRAAAEAHGADVVVGCGGGQTLDAAKYAAFLADRPCVSVPTQATHDGLCSPVAVLRGPAGARASSYGARPPAALLVPLHVIVRAPRRALVSGIADLASNLVALEDWRWAHEFRGEDFDDYAALLARSGAQLVVSRRDVFAPERPFSHEDVELLVSGLVLSGLAMTLAASSRPCSGAEHLISHAFDLLDLGHGSHGEQVGVGCTLARRLYAADLEPVVELLERVGAPLTPQAIGITRDDATRAVKMAHLVRPERQTRLSTALVADPDYIDGLVEATWFS